MSTEPRTWDYAVTALIRVVDGDTMDLTLSRVMDFGFRLVEEKSWSSRFRLLGIDTPERNEAGGNAATAFTLDWLVRAIGHGICRGQTWKADSFGRWLVDLYVTDPDGTTRHLADALRAAGHEKPVLP